MIIGYSEMLFDGSRLDCYTREVSYATDLTHNPNPFVLILIMSLCCKGLVLFIFPLVNSFLLARAIETQRYIQG